MPVNETGQIERVPPPPSSAVDAVARRRLRALEAAYPSVLDGCVRIQPPPSDAQDRRFVAQVRVQVVGGHALHADGCGHDALAALRLAFNALELGLEEDQASARVRAAAWLATVRQRMRGWPEFR